MFYASSKSPRVKGKELLDDTIVIYRARQEANMVIFSFRQMWNVLKLIRILTVFYATGIEWWFLWVVGTGQNYNSGARFSGKITSAVLLVTLQFLTLMTLLSRMMQHHYELNADVSVRNPVFVLEHSPYSWYRGGDNQEVCDTPPKSYLSASPNQHSFFQYTQYFDTSPA